MYDIEGALPDDIVSEFYPGTNVLIKGPPMIGKQNLAIELLAKGFDDGGGGVLCIATSDSTSALIDAFSQVTSFDRDHIGVVNCSGGNPSRAPSDVTTEFVSTPSDLTGTSIGTVKILQTFSERNLSAVRHGVLSVSTLLNYLDVTSVFKFLHIYTTRISDTDGLGIFTLDSTTQESETIQTLSGEFDGTIELREVNDGAREVRLTGLSTASRNWFSY